MSTDETTATDDPAILAEALASMLPEGGEITFEQDKLIGRVVAFLRALKPAGDDPAKRELMADLRALHDTALATASDALAEERTERLRDEFAKAAMQAVIGMDGAKIGNEMLAIPHHADVVAEAAYAMADAMLRERAK